MPSLTIKQARRILGNKAKNISDELLQRDIDTAELLKELFFDQMLANSKEKKPKYTS